MGTLFYSLMGLKLRADMPFDVEITDESLRFLRQTEESPDEWVRFMPVEVLPPLPNGLWHKDRLFADTSEGKSVYYRCHPGGAAYARVVYQDGGKVSFSYLSDSREMPRHTKSLINLLGLEQIFLRHDALILHASFIRWQGRGILFSAPSGTGKSTQAGLWAKYMGADILNGDRAGIRQIEGQWRAYGLPYAGTSGIYRDEFAPISAIVILRQGPENVIRSMKMGEALRALLPEFSLLRWDGEFMNRAMDICAELLAGVPAYLLECRPDRGAVELLRDTILNEESL